MHTATHFGHLDIFCLPSTETILLIIVRGQKKKKKKKKVGSKILDEIANVQCSFYFDLSSSFAVSDGKLNQGQNKGSNK